MLKCHHSQAYSVGLRWCEKVSIRMVAVGQICLGPTAPLDRSPDVENSCWRYDCLILLFVPSDDNVAEPLTVLGVRLQVVDRDGW